MKGLVVEKVFQVEESRFQGWSLRRVVGSSLRQKTQEEDHLGGAGHLESLEPV